MGGGNIVMSSFWASKVTSFITAPLYTRSLTVLNRKPKLNGPRSAETRPHILKKVAAMLGFFAFGDAGSGVTASRFHGLGFWGVGLQISESRIWGSIPRPWDSKGSRVRFGFKDLRTDVR